MPEFDGTATNRTCVDVSDVLINVASDRSDHQCCGSCMALVWLLLLGTNTMLLPHLTALLMLQPSAVRPAILIHHFLSC